MKKAILVLLVVFMATFLSAQTKEDIDGNNPITWIGLDCSHLKYISSATQLSDTGDVSSQVLFYYFQKWSNMFCDGGTREIIGKLRKWQPIPMATYLRYRGN